MFKFMYQEKKAITRGLASEIAKMESVQCERTRKPSRVATLEQHIASGHLRAFNWAIACLGQRKIRVNGGHTSHILSREDVAIPPEAIALIEHYSCDTMADVVALWTTFDAQESSRTKNENLAVFAGNTPVLAGIDRRRLATMMGALAIEAANLGVANNCTRQKKHDLLARNAEFCIFYDALPSTKSGEEIRDIFVRVGVCIAVLKTWRVDASDCLAFWTEVATKKTVTGEHFMVDGPSEKLREFLLSTDTRNGQGARSGRTAVPWDTIYKKSVVAWNHWRDGTVPDRLTVTSKLPVPR